MINLSCKVIACGIILSSVKLEKKVQHSENDIRISHNLLSPSPSLSKDYCIRSFWSQNTEKRNNTISQMRLRSVFKMRMSILNTATTEQMGYGIISFFVCFLSTNLMSYIIIKGCDSCFICSNSYYIFYIIKEDLTIAVLAGVKCFLCGFYN